MQTEDTQQSPSGDSGQTDQTKADAQAPAHKPVDLWAPNVPLPADEAVKAIAWRDSMTQKQRELESELNKYRTQTEEQRRKVEQEQARAEENKLLQQGEFEKAVALREQEFQKRLEEEIKKREAKISTFAERNLDATLESGIRSVEGVDPSDAKLIGDIKAVLKGRVRLNSETGESEWLGEDGYPVTDGGKPVPPTEGIKRFLEDRPYFLKKTVAHTPGGATPMQNAGGDAKAGFHAAIHKMLGQG